MDPQFGTLALGPSLPGDGGASSSSNSYSLQRYLAEPVGTAAPVAAGDAVAVAVAVAAPAADAIEAMSIEDFRAYATRWSELGKEIKQLREVLRAKGAEYKSKCSTISNFMQSNGIDDLNVTNVGKIRCTKRTTNHVAPNAGVIKARLEGVLPDHSIETIYKPVEEIRTSVSLKIVAS